MSEKVDGRPPALVIVDGGTRYQRLGEDISLIGVFFAHRGLFRASVNYSTAIAERSVERCCISGFEPGKF